MDRGTVTVDRRELEQQREMVLAEMARRWRDAVLLLDRLLQMPAGAEVIARHCRGEELHP